METKKKVIISTAVAALAIGSLAYTLYRHFKKNNICYYGDDEDVVYFLVEDEKKDKFSKKAM